MYDRNCFRISFWPFLPGWNGKTISVLAKTIKWFQIWLALGLIWRYIYSSKSIYVQILQKCFSKNSLKNSQKYTVCVLGLLHFMRILSFRFWYIGFGQNRKFFSVLVSVEKKNDCFSSYCFGWNEKILSVIHY